MRVIEQLKWRYATKKFDANKVLTNDKLNILKEAFNLTALSYGLQSLKLVIVKDKEKRNALVDVSFGQLQVVDASHLLIICVQDQVDNDDINAHFENIKQVRNTPEQILEPFRNQMLTTLENMPDEKKANWIVNQAYITLGNLMTVCAIEQIDSCPMEGFVSEAYDELLNLNSLGLKSVLLLPVGYRAEDDMFADFKKVRKPMSETIIEL